MREPLEAREGRQMIEDALAWEARDAMHAAGPALHPNEAQGGPISQQEAQLDLWDGGRR